MYRVHCPIMSDEYFREPTAEENKATEDFLRAICTRLRAARGDRTQADVCRAASAHHTRPLYTSELSDYERGRKWPRIPLLRALALALGVSIDWLITGKSEAARSATTP